MTAKTTIIAAINAKVGTGYSAWRIGLTHDLADRKKFWGETEKQNVFHWSAWTADSLKDAQEIESFFINKGINGGTGGDLDSRKTTCVYVF